MERRTAIGTDIKIIFVSKEGVNDIKKKKKFLFLFLKDVKNASVKKMKLRFHLSVIRWQQ